MRADLHMHSRVSDGSDEIIDLITLCKQQNLTHIALTDHDTFEGWEKAQKICRQLNIATIKSSEISCRDPKTKIKAHILAYDIKDTAELEKWTKSTLDQRHQCSIQTVKELQEKGYDISVEAVRPYYKKTLYKQQIMEYLIHKGYADAIYGDLYRGLFYNPGTFRFTHPYPDPAQVVRAIVSGGGKAVLAHPGQQENFELLPELKRAGLWGIELCHQSNDQDHKARIKKEARRWDFRLTGGSDYHGRYAPHPVIVGDYLCPKETIQELFSN